MADQASKDLCAHAHVHVHRAQARIHAACTHVIPAACFFQYVSRHAPCKPTEAQTRVRARPDRHAPARALLARHLEALGEHLWLGTGHRRRSAPIAVIPAHQAFNARLKSPRVNWGRFQPQPGDVHLGAGLHIRPDSYRSEATDHNSCSHGTRRTCAAREATARRGVPCTQGTSASPPPTSAPLFVPRT